MSGEFDPAKTTANPPLPGDPDEWARRAVWSTVRPDGSFMWDFTEGEMKRRLALEGWKQ